MSDAADDLDLIPRSMRVKLDRARVKLHLRQWQRLSLDERRQLCDQPCDAAAEVERYRSTVIALVRARTGEAPDDLPG